VLLDLCFYTGRVTEQSDRKTAGMPEGRDGDTDPNQYFGLQILERIHGEFPDLPVIILSSMPREEISREFTSKGAFGFLPREREDSPELLKEYIWRHGLIRDETGEVVGCSKSLLLTLRSARRAASNRRNVLIRGERGAGKELLARYVWREGRRDSTRPFVIVNSAALSPTLFASELFGIKRRVATGVEERGGMIPSANKGDLFFDEIRDMSPEAQAGVLRVLEDRQIIPVGARTPIQVDVRFLSATNADVEEMAATGLFRPDLLDRLREGGAIFLPPLRARKADIPLLVEKFVQQAQELNSRAMKRDIDEGALDKIHSYDWPGNIRELRNCIFEAINSYPDVEHLVAEHIRLPEPHGRRSEIESSLSTEPPSISGVPPGTMDEIFHQLSRVTFDSTPVAQLSGKLTRLQSIFARIMAEYLRAALIATRKLDLQNLKGKPLIHPAAKLMTGNASLSASKAADIVKKLLGIHPESAQQILSDPILKEAYEIAVRLRPRRAKQQRKARNKAL
jgi:DNA-binding NtrC family response regulator